MTEHRTPDLDRRAFVRLGVAGGAASLVAACGWDGGNALRPRLLDISRLNDWDMASALHPQTILAYGMNDNPLPPAHGAPLRLYSPTKLGYKMTKYLVSLTFTDRRPGGYWEDQGYPWFGGI